MGNIYVRQADLGRLSKPSLVVELAVEIHRKLACINRALHPHIGVKDALETRGVNVFLAGQSVGSLEKLDSDFLIHL